MALEQLLGGPCYHMIEVFEHPDMSTSGIARPKARRRLVGRSPRTMWRASIGRAAAFWREMADANPDAIILLSSRSSADAWYKSASDTIFQAMEACDDAPGWIAMVEACSPTASPRTSMTRRRRSTHTSATTPTCGPPLTRNGCWTGRRGRVGADLRRVGVPVPEEPFPHVNTTEEFRAMAGLRRDMTG